MGFIRIGIKPLLKSQIEPTGLRPKQKRPIAFFGQRFGLIFIFVNHGSPFLSDTHFLYCDYWLGGLIISIFLIQHWKKVNKKEGRIKGFSLAILYKPH